MTLFKNKSFRVICALFAFLTISGDLVADSIHDASGACVTESESQNPGHDSCPNCVCCTVHNGSALACNAVALLAPGAAATDSISVSDDQPAAGWVPAIDHPPQLS